MGRDERGKQKYGEGSEEGDRGMGKGELRKT